MRFIIGFIVGAAVLCILDTKAQVVPNPPKPAEPAADPQ